MQESYYSYFLFVKYHLGLVILNSITLIYHQYQRIYLTIICFTFSIGNDDNTTQNAPEKPVMRTGSLKSRTGSLKSKSSLVYNLIMAYDI